MSYSITSETLSFLADNNVELTGRDSDGWEWGIGSVIYDGDSFELGALTGFKITSITYRSLDGWDESLTVSSDGLTATMNSYDGTPLTDFNITTVSANEPSFDFMLTQSDIDSVSEFNGTLFVNDEPAIDGTGVNIGDTWKVTVPDGELINAVSFRDLDGFEISWEISEDELTATYVHDSSFSFNGFYLETREQQAEHVRGINDVYKLNPDDLRIIIKESFKRFDGQETTDYSKYLLGLIEIPFDIPSEMVTGVTGIQFGDYATGVTGELLNSDSLTVDMGSITVTSDKGNFLDYANSFTVLYLPYAEPVTLETDFVINETISIQYVINLYDGVTNINISSTKTGGVIATRTVDLNVSVPFGNVDSYPSNNSPYNIELGGFNGITSPYIELLRNDAILENGFFTTPIIDETTLDTCNGFVIVDEIKLVSNATYSEKQEIINELKNGVIL